MLPAAPPDGDDGEAAGADGLAGVAELLGEVGDELPLAAGGVELPLAAGGVLREGLEPCELEPLLSQAARANVAASIAPTVRSRFVIIRSPESILVDYSSPPPNYVFFQLGTGEHPEKFRSLHLMNKERSLFLTYKFMRDVSEAFGSALRSTWAPGEKGRYPRRPRAVKLAGGRFSAGSQAMRNIRVDGERLWRSLMEMARIGATEKGGVCRLALTDLDREGRRLFIRWCEEAGCTVRVDRMGNIFARRPGRNPAAAPVMTGSHLDTQPTGGRFDGAYGVLAGLEVVRTLNDLAYETEAPVEVVVWTNEEGARFSPAMVGSGVYAGVFSLEEGLRKPDNQTGVTMGAELERIGFAGPEPCGGQAVRCYFEAHIEQGPILEAEGKTIGIVTGANGQRWYEVTVTGQEAHAGPTPMKRRKDALVGAARMIDAVNRIGHAHPPWACATVGFARVSPNSRNTIPGNVFFTVDFRHPEDATLSEMDRELREACRDIARLAQVEVEVKEFWYFPPTPFDGGCVEAVRRAAAEHGFPAMEIISGAGHDAVYMARVAPTAMIFVPCRDGISHNEIEDAKPEDLAQGGTVLLNAILERANARDEQKEVRP